MSKMDKDDVNDMYGFLAFLVFAGVFLLYAMLASCSSKMTNKSLSHGYGPCDPTYPHTTFNLQCFSGGQLVYTKQVYKSGGYLCTMDNRQVDIDDKSQGLCIMEEVR
jgi:hypothetical protein